MSDQFVHLFPLSVYRDTLGISSNERDSLSNIVLQMEQAHRANREGQHVDSAWLGDEHGHEFLFQLSEFKPLFHRMAIKVREYTAALGMNVDMVDFYFQRAWATVTRKGKRINQHSHEQSNISVAYYVKKPQQSGGINFITENHPNEFSRGVFTPAKEGLGFIQRPSLLTWNVVTLDPEEDDIVVFPSKTLHSTLPNESDAPRISISADVTTMLRNSHGHETMMPHFSNWRSLDDFLDTESRTKNVPT